MNRIIRPATVKFVLRDGIHPKAPPMRVNIYTINISILYFCAILNWQGYAG